jgi:recombination protein RecA
MAIDFESVIKEINKQSGDVVITCGDVKRQYEKIPFSSPKACWMTYGGIPLYHITEFSGPENSGKTTSAIDVAANYQKRPDAKRIVYVDVEHTFDTVWATKLGLDVSKIYLYQPDGQAAEDIFNYIIKLLETDEVGFLVLDSLASMVSRNDLENDMDYAVVCGIAKLMTKFVNRVVPVLRKYKCTFIGINQVRENLGNKYDPYVTPGGKAWKHQCSLRIMFHKGKYIDKDGKELGMNPDSPAGNIVKMVQLKTKCSLPDRHLTTYTLNYYSGIRVFEDTVETAEELGLLFKQGAWYKLYDIDTGELMDVKLQGMNSVIEYMRKNTEYYNKLRSKVLQEISKEPTM